MPAWRPARHPDKVAELAAKMLEACDGDYANGHIGSHFQGYEDERATAHLRQGYGRPP